MKLQEGKGKKAKRNVTNSLANSTYCPLWRCQGSRRQGQPTLPACLKWVWDNPATGFAQLVHFEFRTVRGFFTLETIENNWIEKLVCIKKVTCSSSVCNSIRYTRWQCSEIELEIEIHTEWANKKYFCSVIGMCIEIETFKWNTVINKRFE